MHLWTDGNKYQNPNKEYNETSPPFLFSPQEKNTASITPEYLHIYYRNIYTASLFRQLNNVCPMLHHPIEHWS